MATRTASLTWNSFTYALFDPALVNSWEVSDLTLNSDESESLCGAWTFDIEMGNGDPLISAFTKDLVAKTLTTYSEDFALTSP